MNWLNRDPLKRPLDNFDLLRHSAAPALLAPCRRRDAQRRHPPKP